MTTLRSSSQRAIELYDRLYRFWHSLDTPRSALPPVLRIETRRIFRTVRLSDGTTIRRGDRIGVLHMNNEQVGALHGTAATPMALGLEFRRAFLASLRELAGLVAPGGPLADLPAFAAVTILHHGLPRFGFERDPHGLVWPRVTAAYQRALLASLHPSGSQRLLRLANGRAERLWISRERLLALYGDVHARPPHRISPPRVRQARVS